MEKTKNSRMLKYFKPSGKNLRLKVIFAHQDVNKKDKPFYSFSRKRQ